MPAFNAIASALQKVTRMVALRVSAPPARAPIAPSNARNARNARNASDAMDKIGTRAVEGAISTIASGIAAPTAKVAADWMASGRLEPDFGDP